MELSNEKFKENFENLHTFFEMKNPDEIAEFLKQKEDLFVLLNQTKNHLKEIFPKGKFELEMSPDLSGEGNDMLLINIYVDNETFNNELTDRILKIDMKILPLQKKLNLTMDFCLMEGIPPLDK